MNIGFIGLGNMGSALIGSIAKKKNYVINIYDIDKSKMKNIIDSYSSEKSDINIVNNYKTLATQSKYIFLCVKPHIVKQVVKELSEYLTKEHVLVSIAVGVTIEQLKEYSLNKSRIVRTMPNTPALVNEGMTMICFDDINDKNTQKNIVEIFNCAGRTSIIPEDKIDSVIALTSSSPAYIFMLIEAMADAAVLSGLNRQESYELAAQSVLGSAKMVLETKKHPGELKDNVCSPGGTTIEALRILEKKGFRSSIIEAMIECTNKAIKIKENEKE